MKEKDALTVHNWGGKTQQTEVRYRSCQIRLFSTPACAVWATFHFAIPNRLQPV